MPRRLCCGGAGRRWVGDAGALVAGVVFAVHPVHVEAVATSSGAELMATAFTLLAVYAAVDATQPGLEHGELDTGSPL